MESSTVVGILTAAAALAGVFLSQLSAALLAHLDRRHKKMVLYRTKYEEVVEHLHRSLEWAGLLISAQSPEELQARNQPMDARRIYALTLLYFPLLKQEAQEYMVSCMVFQNTILDAYRTSVPAKAGAQAVAHLPNEFSEAVSRMQAARQSLDEKIEVCASRYIAA